MEEAKAVIASQAFHMKRALDNNKIMDAINHASLMVSELRTSLLNPQEYYQLCLFNVKKISPRKTPKEKNHTNNNRRGFKHKTCHFSQNTFNMKQTWWHLMN